MKPIYPSPFFSKDSVQFYIYIKKKADLGIPGLSLSPLEDRKERKKETKEERKKVCKKKKVKKNIQRKNSNMDIFSWPAKV